MSDQERSGGASGAGKGCAILGCGGLLLLGVSIAALVVFLAFRGTGTSGPTILVLDLTAPVPERADPDFASLWGRGSIDLIGLRRALAAAQDEADVAGLLVKVSASGLGAGKAEEIWRLLTEFRESGKLVVAHLDGADMLGYLVATAAEEVLLDRTSWLNTVGLQMRAFFLKDTFAKFGLKADLVRVGDYKGAYEQFTAAEPSPEFDVAMDALVDSLYGSMLSMISQARGLESDALGRALNRAPLLPDEALEAKLVDRLVWSDEIQSILEERVGSGVSFVRVGEYLRRQPEPRSDKVFAMIHVTGMISEGSTESTVVGGPMAGAATIVRALRAAAKAPDVAGIIVRIDSGGGGVSASEKIWRAVDRASKRKPVVASMGAAAASGGYYVACAADKILAQRMTLTGSIGIFGGKLVLGDLLEQQKVGTREYGRGEHAGLYDMTRAFSADERRTLQTTLEAAYRTFVKRVADGRRRTFAEIDAVAQGRVWTGQAAVDVGLVDDYGGLSSAVEALRELATVGPEEAVTLRLYPEPANWYDLVLPDTDEPVISTFSEILRQGNGGPSLLVQELSQWVQRTQIFAAGKGMALMPVALEAK